MSSGKGNKSKNKQIGLHQTKKFYHGIVNCLQNEKSPTEWDKIFENNVFDKGLK